MIINTPPAVTAAITGHRPNKLPNLQYVKAQLALAYADLKVDWVIQGMAAGVDLMSAGVAFENYIPYICVKPWEGHKAAAGDEFLYLQTITHAQDVVVVDPSEAFPGNWVYQKRNEWMVDHSNVVIAVWDSSRGGTHNAVQYALKKKVPVYCIDPLLYTVGFLDA